MKNNKSLHGLLLFLFLFLCGYKYLSSNINFVYATLANHYFKKNEISKSQEYFEKAFDAGCEDSKSRDIYVNSIINTPLTIKSQEKLVKILEKGIEDSASLKVEYFLYDIAREIHRKYPQNYIANAVYNQKLMRWNKMPITYDFINTGNVPNYYIDEFDNAFNEIEKATNHLVLFSQEKNNPNIIIDFVKENPAEDNHLKYVVAYTTPNTTLNKLENMEIIFYSKNPKNKFYTRNEVYNTALHELIHALGFMGHSDNPEDVMYLTKDSKTLRENMRKQLSKADIDTITLLYKTKPDITNSFVEDSEYIPHLVLGTKENLNDTKIEEAKLYINKAPHLPSGYMDLAETYVGIKDYESALVNLKKALRLADSEDIQAMICYNLAVVYLYSDDIESAKKCIKYSMNINDSEEKHYLLGEILVKEGDYDSAIKEYSQLLKKNPNNIDYAIALINIHVLNREYFKARKVLKEFWNNNPHERNNSKFNSYGILKIFL